MNSRNFRAIGIVIVLIIALTTLLQGYYLYQDYLRNKELFMNEVQQSLDNSVEEYYAELAKSDVLMFTDVNEMHKWADSTDHPASPLFISDSLPGNFFERFNGSRMAWEGIRALDSGRTGELRENFVQLQRSGADSLHVTYYNIQGDSVPAMMVDRNNAVAMSYGRSPGDSLLQLRNLTSRIIISITRDTLDFEKLNHYLQNELDRKNLQIAYSLAHLENDSVSGSYNSFEFEQLPLTTFARSTYLPRNQQLEMHYANASLIILRKGIGNILLSGFFLVMISAVLMYLYRVIRSQKELSGIKNDLISNITHEFKTPIATVSTALEGISNFNEQNDPEKTRKYLSISQDQLVKLNSMVEKLLETAALDSERLILHKEPTDIAQMLRELTDKFRTLSPGKSLELQLPGQDELPWIALDVFHFENAVSNLVDNAIKYGGSQIDIIVRNSAGKVEVIVRDNGGPIPRKEQQRIFEKFYRIPKGNIHDVKGFGIGLYYSRHIIEKHGGTLILNSEPGSTEFKILLDA